MKGTKQLPFVLIEECLFGNIDQVLKFVLMQSLMNIKNTQIFKNIL